MSATIESQSNVPSVPNVPHATIDATMFRNMVRYVSVACASSSAMMPVLEGIEIRFGADAYGSHFHPKDGGLSPLPGDTGRAVTLAATDRYSLMVATRHDFAKGEAITGVLSGKTLVNGAELARITKGWGSDKSIDGLAVEISTHDGLVDLALVNPSHAQIVSTATLRETVGEFPAWSAIVENTKPPAGCEYHYNATLLGKLLNVAKHVAQDRKAPMVLMGGGTAKSTTRLAVHTGKESGIVAFGLLMPMRYDA